MKRKPTLNELLLIVIFILVLTAVFGCNKDETPTTPIGSCNHAAEARNQHTNYFSTWGGIIYYLEDRNSSFAIYSDDKEHPTTIVKRVDGLYMSYDCTVEIMPYMYWRVESFDSRGDVLTFTDNCQ